MLTQWEKLKAAQRMQDYIEAHLKEKITLVRLARAARYSPWHAARIFKEITGKAPFEYIRLRRLSLAAEMLRNTDCKVVDVALEFEFDSHEGFTRAFAQQFGLPPIRFRKTASSHGLFEPPQLREWYLRRQRGDLAMASDKEVATIFVQILERPARRLILKRGQRATHYFEYCEEVGCDVWEILTGINDALHEPMGLWLPERLRRPGTSEYVQGVEVPSDYSGPVPEGFDIIDLPPCKILVFQGAPYEEKGMEKAITAVWDAMNSYRPENFGYQWADDDAPRFQLQPEGHRGYIEGRPVRSL